MNKINQLLRLPDKIYADTDLVCAEEPGDDCKVEYIRADSSIFADMKSALEACRAWHIAEDKNIGSHHDRMELCHYSHWLTNKTLAKVNGKIFTEEYKGLLRIVLGSSNMMGTHRASETDITNLIDGIIASTNS